ncbi:general stress protein [Crocosphaera sp. UHCC 0190]|uniref:general stress protein n=1 Tax=Crocosphaera sp. UHCC 0190 TaxID=3110246 RepID=UPI002B217992|nr:general stress protein [Crocosphaera sp. UHCC 0190]MEA5509398.1 general stress protein [Crocosphaera sp. UHCC 0190]
MILTQRAVGTFSNYEATERALHELKENGFLMEQVLVVGRDMNRQTEETGANTTNRLIDVGNLDTNEHEVGQTAAEGSVAGGAVGGLAGLLIGLGIVAIPGVGPIMLAGAAATTIATALSGTVIGAAAGSLAGGLVGLGIPADRAKVYSDRILRGDYLVMVEGSEADIDVAKSVLTRHGIEKWYVYDLTDDSVQTPTTTSIHQTKVQTMEKYPEKSLHREENQRPYFSRVDTENYR